MKLTYTEYQVLKSIVHKYEQHQLKLMNFQLPDPKKTRKLEDMDISVRLYNCLTNHGIYTIDQLVENSIYDLFKIRNFGQKTFKETKSLLDEYGMELRNH
jgi:DNA-directed RNA polymerase alpha subunit